MKKAPSPQPDHQAALDGIAQTIAATFADLEKCAQEAAGTLATFLGNPTPAGIADALQANQRAVGTAQMLARLGRQESIVARMQESYVVANILALERELLAIIESHSKGREEYLETIEPQIANARREVAKAKAESSVALERQLETLAALLRDRDGRLEAEQAARKQVEVIVEECTAAQTSRTTGNAVPGCTLVQAYGDARTAAKAIHFPA